jgi:nitroreductase
MAEAMLELIRSRRVTRAMSDRPIALDDLEAILDAGRWAPTGGNQRVVRFVAVRDPATLKVLRMVSPGMLQHPAAVVVLCLDRDAIRGNEIPEDDPVLHVDVGTAMQTMLLAAHALGIGSGPVTSFAREAVRVVLNLPAHLTPELIVCLGYMDPHAPQVPMRGGPRITWQSLTHWERYPEASHG